MARRERCLLLEARLVPAIADTVSRPRERCPAIAGNGAAYGLHGTGAAPAGVRGGGVRGWCLRNGAGNGAAYRRHGIRRHGIRRHGIRRHGIRRHGIRRHGIRRHGIRRHGIRRHGIRRHGTGTASAGVRGGGGGVREIKLRIIFLRDWFVVFYGCVSLRRSLMTASILSSSRSGLFHQFLLHILAMFHPLLSKNFCLITSRSLTLFAE